MTVPFAFANLSGTIALSKLDSNFNTPITIGNTSVQLGNTITTVNNLTLANVTITSGTSNVTNVNVTSINVTNVTATLANITTLNATSAFITTGNIATANVGNLSLLNPLTVPNGGTGRVTLPVSDVLLGNGTGSITSVAPGNAGNVLTSVGGVWVSNALVSLSVGGSNGQVQYNNANSLAGSANLTFDGANLGVGVASTGGSKVYISGGSLASSPSASGIGISGNLTSGRLVTQGSGQLQSIHSFFDSSSLEISQGSTGTQTGIVINGGSAVNNPSTLQFFTSLAERVRVDSSGNVTLQKNISVGGASPTTSGTGITFPATLSASTDANTLDDYEEGSWTPSLGGTAVYDIQYGNYVKIGRMVYVSGALRPTSIGTGSTTTISGLPFSVTTNSLNSGGQPGFYDSCASSIVSMTLDLDATAITLQSKTAAGTAVNNGISTAFFGNNTRLYFSATYQTD